MMRRRRGGIGLLGTMAVGGVAYAAGSGAAKQSAAEQAQNRRLAEMEAAVAAQQTQLPPAPAAPAAPPPGGSSMDERIEQLQKLADLKNTGLLTEEEFEAQKARILAS